MTAKQTILLGFTFAPAFRQALAERYEVLGPIGAHDPALVPAEAARRIRALVTVGSYPTGAAMMDALPNLSIVCCFGTGYDKVDMDEARRRGIAVTHSPDANAACVADLAMGLVLASMRRIPEADRFVRAGKWEMRGAGRFPPVASVGGSRLGVLGLGAIGRRVALRAAAFEMEVGYHSRTARADAPWPRFASAEALAEWADVLVVALRADDSNRHIVGSRLLEALGPRGHLVNVSRGSAVDEAALAEALHAGRLAGAALDVFDEEPAIPRRLLEAPNMVFTPHLGGGTPRAHRAMMDLVLRNLEAHFAGAPLVTPAKWPL